MMANPSSSDLNLGHHHSEKSEEELSFAPASTASSETLSQKLDQASFPPVFDDEISLSSEPSSQLDCIVPATNHKGILSGRRGTVALPLVPATGNGRIRIHRNHTNHHHHPTDVSFIPRAYSESSVKHNNNGYGRWVGAAPHVNPNRNPPDVPMMPCSNGPHHHDPIPACTVQATAAAVVKPVILQTLSIPRERYHHEDYPEDPLLSKDSTAGDMSPSLYARHTATPLSNSSSPPGNRRLHHDHHQYTVIPMKVIPKEERKVSRQSGNDALCLVLSALYGKLLVVMGIAFPMSEVISTYIPPSFYDGFYLYLYFGSITFMICILGNILRLKATRSVRTTIKNIHSMKSRLTTTGSTTVAPDVTSNDPPEVSCDSEGSCSDSLPPSRLTPNLHRAKLAGINGSVIEPAALVEEDPYAAYQRIHFGSFYLRMGAVAFGIGSMIYSGLEFGQYFELQPDTKCHNILIALTPSVRMMFTFMQMYFIFLNSKMTVAKFRLGSQFGLMHMIGTNLCVWLNVLVQETRHEILQFYNPDNNTITLTHLGYARGSHGGGGGHHGYGLGHARTTTATTTATTTTTMAALTTTESPLKYHRENMTGSTLANMVINAGEAIAHKIVKRGLKGPHSIYECRRTNIMGALVQNASPFLFPCTIEYSLICAAILYVMWKSLAKERRARDRSLYAHGDPHLYPGTKRSPHHYSVDCARANKGLFVGIFVLVLTIISLILFFVLITRPGYQELATMEVNITELVLYTITTVAVLIGMCQMRELKYVPGRNLELDNILLIVAQTGSFIYNVFTIIGGHFMMRRFNVFVLITALASLIQLLFQTLFILDASKRSAATADQARRKPGREVVTFLLVTNLAMWAINTLEKSRADSHPVQLRFYGVWAWTIITHISMPLAIFYRFHSTVCLCEIWKRAYKVKHSISYH